MGLWLACAGEVVGRWMPCGLVEYYNPGHQEEVFLLLVPVHKTVGDLSIPQLQVSWLGVQNMSLEPPLCDAKYYFSYRD